jgi:serine/threonine-protein kinase
MTPERWQRIEELYHSAREQSPDERTNWLAEACAGDEPLRREIEALLEANEQAKEFLTGHALDWKSET